MRAAKFISWVNIYCTSTIVYPQAFPSRTDGTPVVYFAGHAVRAQSFISWQLMNISAGPHLPRSSPRQIL